MFETYNISTDFKKYNIYETKEECNAAGVTVIFPPEIRPDTPIGTYLCSSNGYYLPIIRISTYAKRVNTHYLEVAVPRLLIKCRYNDRLNKTLSKNIFYSKDRRYNGARQFKRDTMVIELVHKGWDLYDAIVYCYKNKTKTSMMEHFMRFIRYDKLYEQIQDAMSMAIHDKLKQKNITEDKILSIIANSLNSEKFNERKWATELSIKLINSQKEIKQLPQANQELNDIKKLLK